jgi:hypothetical protein
MTTADAVNHAMQMFEVMGTPGAPSAQETTGAPARPSFTSPQWYVEAIEARLDLEGLGHESVNAFTQSIFDDGCANFDTADEVFGMEYIVLTRTIRADGTPKFNMFGFRNANELGLFNEEQALIGLENREVIMIYSIPEDRGYSLRMYPELQSLADLTETMHALGSAGA